MTRKLGHDQGLRLTERGWVIATALGISAFGSLILACIYIGGQHPVGAWLAIRWLIVVAVAGACGVWGERVRQVHERRRQARVWEPHHTVPHVPPHVPPRLPLHAQTDRFDVLGTDE